MKLLLIAARNPDQDPILAGRLDGKRVFARVIEDVPPIKQPSILMLDFASVELATSSFLGETVLPLRDHLRARRPPIYLVVANLNEKVQEELDELLHRIGDALLSCQFAPGADPRNVQLLGILKPELLETWELVRLMGETTAVELFSSAKSDRIGPTAWNNRLTALASKGLVVEFPQGRLKKYRSTLEPS